MVSFRTKIVSSFIGLSLVSFAAGAYYTQSLLSERFEAVVLHRYTEGLVRAALTYFRRYESWELAYQNGTFSDYSRRDGESPPPPVLESGIAYLDARPPRFAVTDLDGHVWIPGSGLEVGDQVDAEKLDTAQKIVDRGQAIGFVIPDGDIQTNEVEDNFIKLMSDVWWLALIPVVLVAGPLGFILGHRFSGPVYRLINAISAMGPATMRQKVPVTSSDELGMLSQSFNQLSDDLADFVQVTKRQRKQLAKTEDLLRQSLVNASHELRTPINQAMTRAYAMMDGYRPLTQAEMSTLVDSLTHLASLVDDLYQLALVDEQSLTCDKVSVDFARLVATSVDTQREAFAAKGVDIRLVSPDSACLDGDETRLRQIIDNLLVNSLKYVPSGASVTVTLTQVEHEVRLLVSDTGTGVPEASLNRLFDRFYRVDPSRTRASGGAGLGLSIVKSCVDLHGGQAEAFLNPEGGLSVRITLPTL